MRNGWKERVGEEKLGGDSPPNSSLILCVVCCAACSTHPSLLKCEGNGYALLALCPDPHLHLRMPQRVRYTAHHIEYSSMYTHLV